MKFSYPGLSDNAVSESRKFYGANVVTAQEAEGFFDKLRTNLKDPIIVILIVALAVTVFLAAMGFAPWYEGLGIAFAVVMATLIATWSEYSNENEFQRLLEEASKVKVKVFRNSTMVEILIDDLVVNDLVLLQPGDTVPADGYLLTGEIELNESALTGESETVKKTGGADEKHSEAEEKYEMSRAALVVDGEAVMKVLEVGDKTKYGVTLKELTSAESRPSPLQEKLATLGRQISRFGYVGALFIAFSFMFNHIFLEGGGWEIYFSKPTPEIIYHIVTAIILAIIIIVVAVPEGLPMMIAVVLSMNMRKLLKAKVLVRKLLGIETSGSLTILFTDKTGTLTQGKLTVSELLLGNAEHFQSYKDIPENLRETVSFALRNNTPALIDTGDPENPKIVGANPTGQALLRFLDKDLAKQDDVKVKINIPFNSTYKFSATQVEGSQNLTMVKGAAEIVLDGCTHYLDVNGKKVELDSEKIKKEMLGLSKRAMRLIGLAVSNQNLGEENVLPSDLTLVGIFGLRDEMRKESKTAVETVRRAGIQVVMITGDAKDTAQAIASEVGILEKEKELVLTSKELGEISDEELIKILPDLRVVARALPADKNRLVKLAKSMNWVVGMTGDGVNDAPAVKNADVGFSMGDGTDMTKESSDIVILDNNFISLTNAVRYGRTLLKSIRKFLIFQLTVNVAAILVAFLGPFFGIDLPLTMTQLLWVNIVMDTLAAFAFSGEAALKRYMNEKPIPKDESLISGDMWSAILIDGIFMASISIYFLTSDFVAGLFVCDEVRCPDPELNLVLLTGFFGFFVFMNNFNKFNARTEGLNLFEHITENRNFLVVVILIFFLQTTFTYFGGEVLRTVGLTLEEWFYVLAFAITIIPLDLTRKFLRNTFVGNPVV
ncbi:MAG: calcium-translocating P-type ATPase, PMCA-type [Deltaproteobacteria bacterium]|jgi:calcium-translocating P-type ATPase|nr:calcium-translocating P-type ATPase, PMCA-type [Deltaproteobacteria bacterium]MBT5086561.1 calcium-translocating P-type ATPase, PMCA-type [Deltaproteobacteria bacterium]